MKRSLPWVWSVGLAIVMPLAVAGQQSLAEVQVSDLETMHEKFTSLAEAFPESAYDWRPMEGVRSVREVMALAAAEGNLFPQYMGLERASGSAEGFRDEMARLTAMSKADLIAEMHRAFEHFVNQVEGLDEEGRMAKLSFFGEDVERGTAVTMAANDMHEHLGQAIAYARTNKIVPPWSRSEGM